MKLYHAVPLITMVSYSFVRYKTSYLFPLENVFAEDELLLSCVTDRSKIYPDLVNSVTSGSSTEILPQSPVSLNLPSTSSIIPPENVRLFLKSQQRKKINKRRLKSKSNIITNTAVKN
ncbi:hypothetical protein AVEN_92960-1 [Araneus ventricosus]|uniref:Uncharacterized protein n=1 Tax=Araneus ventricosus TaxID=182803 RepID=A0A4Y2LUR3_ARAVE|nr:hypothetical protein AVEN_92960-1 [Araneus ventricosus]